MRASSNVALDYGLLEFLKWGWIRNAEEKSRQQSSSASLQRPPALDCLCPTPVADLSGAVGVGGGDEGDDRSSRKPEKQTYF